MLDVNLSKYFCWSWKKEAIGDVELEKKRGSYGGVFNSPFVA
jgi:hypothetical protein